MKNELQVVKNALGNIRHIADLTDRHMDKIRELNDRMNGKAKQVYDELINDAIDYEEYNRRMNAIDLEQRTEGDRIEKDYVAACQGKIG